MPKSPIPFIFSTISVGYRPLRSHSRATGRISRLTNSRIVSRNISCSAESSKSIARDVRPPILGRISPLFRRGLGDRERPSARLLGVSFLSHPGDRAARLRELLCRPEAVDRPRLLRRLGRSPHRGGRFRRSVHDGFRHLGLAPRSGRRRAHLPDRDVRQHPAYCPSDIASGDRRRRHRLRQRPQRDPHRADVGAGRGRRVPPGRPGHAQEVRPYGEQAGRARRRGRRQDQGRRRRSAQPEYRDHCSHRRPGGRGARRGDRSCQAVRRRRRGSAVRRGIARRRGDRRDLRPAAGLSARCSTGPKVARRRRSPTTASPSSASP